MGGQHGLALAASAASPTCCRLAHTCRVGLRQDFAGSGFRVFGRALCSSLRRSGGAVGRRVGGGDERGWRAGGGGLQAWAAGDLLHAAWQWLPEDARRFRSLIRGPAPAGRLGCTRWRAPGGLDGLRHGTDLHSWRARASGPPGVWRWARRVRHPSAKASARDRLLRGGAQDAGRAGSSLCLGFCGLHARAAGDLRHPQSEQLYRRARQLRHLIGRPRWLVGGLAGAGAGLGRLQVWPHCPSRAIENPASFS